MVAAHTQKSFSRRLAVSAPIRPINYENHTHCFNRRCLLPALRCDGAMAPVPRAEFLGSSPEGQTPHPIRRGNQSALENGRAAGIVIAVPRRRPDFSDGL